PRCMSNQLKNILKILNIPDVNFHVLRHTFATRCIENNFDIKALSEILGHSSVNITLNRYVHTSLEQKRRNMKKLNL
ncbi:tyrosine-type recombinase/integrase, partial [Ruminococcus gauvreauii]